MVDKPTARPVFMKILPVASATHEISIHEIASNLGYAPKILKIFKGPVEWTILMEYLGDTCTLYDIYGDTPESIPTHLWDRMRTMVTTLYEEHEIEYVDITPYNFIEVDGKLWMIDFRDAQYIDPDVEMNWFLSEFIDGTNSWNPDFY